MDDITTLLTRINVLTDRVAALERLELNPFSIGTWTPTDASGASLSFTSPSGSYFKNNTFVVAFYYLTYPSTANGSNAKVGGLPFACTGANHGRAGTVGYTTNSNVAYAAPDSGAATFGIFNASGGFITNANMSTLNIQGFLIYQTS